jgi:hypothetical protein
LWGCGIMSKTIHHAHLHEAGSCTGHKTRDGCGRTAAHRTGHDRHGEHTPEAMNRLFYEAVSLDRKKPAMIYSKPNREGALLHDHEFRADARL